jgi:palmitoyltransferase
MHVLEPEYTYLTDRPQQIVLCNKCNAVKSRINRTHHCSKCNACILRMDHHCIWINRCIGGYNADLYIRHFNNLHSYIRFLVWSLIGLFFCFGLVIRGAWIIGSSSISSNVTKEEPVSMTMIFIVALNTTICTPLLFILSLLTYNQIKNLCLNVTSIERIKHENSYQENDMDLKQFDIGFYENIKSVMGSYSILWLIWTVNGWKPVQEKID